MQQKLNSWGTGSVDWEVRTSALAKCNKKVNKVKFIAKENSFEICFVD